MRRFGALAIAAAVVLSAVVSAQAGSKVLFRLDDPRGDDHGDGTLGYPILSTIEPGDLDLVRLTAKSRKDGTVFEATFARTIKVPGRQTIDTVGTSLDSIARHGFYTFNLDIYIDTDRKPGSGNRSALPGRNFDIDESDAWERAVILTPRPFKALDVLRKILARHAKDEIRDARGDADRDRLSVLRREIAADVDRMVYFPDEVHVTGRKISFFVPSDFLGGTASDRWSYVVAVTASDIYDSLDAASLISRDDDRENRLMNLPVSVNRESDRLSTTHSDARLVPPVLDILVPAGASQEELLGDYDPASGRPAVLPGVVPAP